MRSERANGLMQLGNRGPIAMILGCRYLNSNSLEYSDVGPQGAKGKVPKRLLAVYSTGSPHRMLASVMEVRWRVSTRTMQMENG